MTRRRISRADRRVAPPTSLTPQLLADLAERLQYVGDSRHKLHPGDYRFIPPVNPRPHKSPCDDKRIVLRAEASALFTLGVRTGMVSVVAPGSTPKYVWAVDGSGEVYEAKTKPPDISYHGYRLGEDEREMRRYILDEWRRRCPTA